jgi:hypothetical protein
MFFILFSLHFPQKADKFVLLFHVSLNTLARCGAKVSGEKNICQPSAGDSITNYTGI